MTTSIVDEKGLLETIPALRRRQLARLRRERKIPFLRLGHHSLLYDIADVIAALKKLEVSK
jgi:hypothetical protein